MRVYEAHQYQSLISSTVLVQCKDILGCHRLIRSRRVHISIDIFTFFYGLMLIDGNIWYKL